MTSRAGVGAVDAVFGVVARDGVDGRSEKPGQSVLAQLAGGVLAGFDVVRQEVGLCLQVMFGKPGLYFAGVVFQVSSASSM